MVRDDYTSGRNEMGTLDPNAGNTAQEIFEGGEQPMATNGNQVRGAAAISLPTCSVPICSAPDSAPAAHRTR